MIKVLIGVCSTREDPRFLESLSKFYNDLSNEYQAAMIIVKNKLLADAQNQIAEWFIELDYDYLLFLDDDHWGHTVEMVDCLIFANAYMATIKSYSRHYPYSCALMKRIDHTYAGIENGEGYRECDLTGFPMTLFRRDLFDKLEKPYFRAKNDGMCDWATDEEFCKRLKILNIKPMGCFQYCLPHGDITQENVFFRREIERNNGENQMLYNLLKRRHQVVKGG